MTQVTETERGFTIVRELDASRDIVFQAWTDPEHLQWFAETEAASSTETNPTTVDLRVGGTWRIDMVESEDRHYATGGVYLEVTPPERLVFIWGATDGWPPIDPDNPEDGPVVTLILEDLGGDQTQMTLQVALPDHLPADEVKEWLSTGMIEGWNQTLDRLEPHLTTIDSDQPVH